MDIKEFIQDKVKKLHEIETLKGELQQITKQLHVIKEGENQEEKAYESNVYETLKKDLEEVVKNLAEACNKLESASLKQDRHLRTLPEVAARLEEGKKSKQIILEIFKEVKRAKITAERKLYEIR
jgi:Holliday junction resolvase RusA-like endonuclease